MSSKVAAALAVDKGAKQLDHYFPDWAEVIDTSSFAIDDSDACILAQLFPGNENVFGEIAGNRACR